MDQEKIRNIFGVVIFPILTAIFFISGAILDKQGLTITGSITLCMSLVLQFLIMKG